MSRKSPTEFSELFQRSPTPESPPELDQRILQYARRNAPEPSRRRQPLWVTATATLSVACVGLLVVLRSGDVAPPETAARQAAPATPAGHWQNVRSVANGTEEQQSNEVLATTSRSEPERQTNEQPLSNSGRPAADAEPDLSYSQAPAKKQAQAQALSRPIPQQASPMPDASTEEEKAGTTVLDEALGMAAPQSLEQATMEEALRNSDRKPQAATKRAKFKVDDDDQISNEDMQESLQEIKKLYAAGKKSAAANAYHELRERCEECELPASLEEALTELDDDSSK